MSVMLPSSMNYEDPMGTLPDSAQNFAVSCLPISGSVFVPSSQVIFDLPNQGFLDPASLMIKYKITYTGTAAGQLLVSGTPVFSPLLRLEVLANSQNIETVNNFNVIENMKTQLQHGVSDKYGFATSYGYYTGTSASPSPVVALESLDGMDYTMGAAVTTFTQSYSAPLSCVLSNCEKMFPLFLFNNVRLQFTLDTAENIRGSAVLTNFSISNFEIVFNQINMGKQIEDDIIRSNPKVNIKTQSFSSSTQPLASGSSGSVSLIFNNRYSSVKSAFLYCGCTASVNKMFDSVDITSGAGEYSLIIGGVSYPQKPLSTTNNKSGIFSDLRRAMNSIFDKNNSLSINAYEFGIVSNPSPTTTVQVPAKFYVGFALQRITSQMKAYFTGVSTASSPVTALISISSALPTAQLHNIMLILNYDAVLSIDTATRQVSVIS